MKRKTVLGLLLIASLFAAPWVLLPRTMRSLSSSLISNNDTERNLAYTRIDKLSAEKRSQLTDDLLRFTTDASWEKRRFALYALRKIGAGPEKTFPALIARLDDENTEVRKETMIVLTEMGARLAPQLVDTLPQKSGRAREGIVNALTAMGDKSVPHLLPLLKKEDAALRALGAELLGKILPAPAEVKTALVPLLKDSDSTVRVKTAVALSGIDPTLSEALPVHIEIVKRNTWDADTAASVKTLSVLGPKAKAAVPALVALLKTSPDNLKDKKAPRPAICESLNKIDPRRNGALGLLWDLKQKDSTLRYRAAYNLSEMTPPNTGALPDLLTAMSDKDVYVRARATVAAARIGFDKSQRLKPALTKKAVESLTVVKDDQVVGFSEIIQNALAIRPPKADEEAAGLNDTPTATAP